MWCPLGTSDITHDPKNGADMAVVFEGAGTVEVLRIKYVIFNRRIFSSYPTSGQPACAVRTYAGPNPHDKHLHISVHPAMRLHDDASPWKITLGPPPEKDVNMAIPEKYHRTLIDLPYAVQYRNSHASALGFLIDDARKSIITRDELDAAVKKVVGDTNKWTNTKIAAAVAAGSAGGVTAVEVIRQIIEGFKWRRDL